MPEGHELLDEDEDFLLVHIRGRTSDVPPEDFGWEEDPLFERGNDPVTKSFVIADSGFTRKRWRRCCRTIERVAVLPRA